MEPHARLCAPRVALEAKRPSQHVSRVLGERYDLPLVDQRPNDNRGQVRENQLGPEGHWLPKRERGGDTPLWGWIVAVERRLLHDDDAVGPRPELRICLDDVSLPLT